MSELAAMDPAGGNKTFLQQRQLFEDRWSGYGDSAGIKNFQGQLRGKDLQKIELFKDYDVDFLDNISHDIAVAVWQKGTILFEEGSYLDLAFYMLDGAVDVYVDKHQKKSSQPIFNATHLDTLEEDEGSVGASASKRAPGKAGENMTFLSSMDFDLPQGESMRLGSGEVFGEIGSLNGWPQSVTARLAQDSTLVHIRLAALREMRKKSDSFKERLDKTYRARALKTQLATTPLFRHVDKAFLDGLTERVELVSHAPGDVIASQGVQADALYMVRSGFVKITQQLAENPVAVSYLSKGMTFGEVELLIEGLDAYQFSAVSVGHTELVKISQKDFEQISRSQPTVIGQLWDFVVDKIKDTGHTRAHLEKADLIEFALAKGLVQGNSILVIDLDVCTRCDDCVQGCTNTHGGRPRFVREGEKYENFLIARSCYHCEDPVCLVGCPTGAIKRTNVGEVVAVEDELCIGCSNCANKCPYDAIVMHDTEQKWSDSAFPKWLRGRERKVASKCDLCYTSSTGPACVNSCPHSCAFRIGSLDDFQELLAVKQMEV